jgi:dipeptidyl aminopeptidase/acylaminoacyl peptidase
LALHQFVQLKVDFETARLDIWHYQDEQNQPQQLLQLNNELRRSFMAVWQPKTSKVVMLGAEDAENVQLVQEGDADFVLATSSKGNRIASQWQGFAKSRAFLIDIATGQRTPVNGDIRGNYSASPDGKFIAWYDWEKKNYFTYEIASKKVTNVSQSLKVTVWDEDDDHPDDPPPHGVAGWAEGDEAMMIYDKFDIWQLDPKGQKTPINITKGIGRKNQVTFRQISFDREKRFVSVGDVVGISIFDHKEKGYAMQLHSVGAQFYWDAKQNPTKPMNISALVKANNAMVFSYVTSQPNVSPTVTIITAIDSSVDASGKQYRMGTATTLSKLNPQQENYNWFTVELHKWKMFDGKMSEGLLFKPENFDSTKKYPVIFYFYEKNADTRYNYRVPAPSASTINIPYFTSNGYLVFDPNIYYKTGQPGEDAYNAIVSAARYLSKMKWVDSTKMAIQGQSWGGYQVSYLVTRTNMFAAAGAGAPVSNMTSAYGGVRWGSGLIRQFQYERSQSRIGATLWQKPDLYIKNSPLFKADKVKTPLLIMHNDKDDAVPWYQGIEYFTALKRLGKPVWMLQYNDEVHNLAERRNRKDLSIRLAQFFDHYLKGAPMPVWMKSGVPATLKGIDWGLGY